MNSEGIFPKQDSATTNLISKSLQHCESAGVINYRDTLPEISHEQKAACRRHVSGHTILIRESSPGYYGALTEVLASHDALLMYVASNLDVYARYGSQKLKEEFRSINLRFGTNLAEELVGTNAVALAAETHGGVWTTGRQNYSEALWPYAFYAFEVHSKYNRMTYVLLSIRKEKLTPAVAGLFKFIESTESVFSSGMMTEDVILKDALFKDRYSEKKTENLLIIVGSTGKITYVNNIFYTLFKMTYEDVINYPLENVVPELSYALEGLSDKAPPPQARKLQFAAVGPIDYYVTCTHTNQRIPGNGMAITAQRVLTVASHQRHEGAARYTFDDLVGVSDEFIQLKLFAERVADTGCTVLIRGESGTGKELFAHSIHNASSRADKPFVSINCAAIPRELIGSELFGYVGGAFTGANRTGAKGKFELADGGTLFLDEIAEMPPDMQSVLLRVLEDGAITRIGGSKPISVDVRLIVATNQDLEEYIRQGKFRLDLFYRLNIISLNMIPLRERREDINALADSFMARYAKAHNKPCDGMSIEARNALRGYNWPGNVRELRNVIERAIITMDAHFIELSDLPPEITGVAPAAQGIELAHGAETGIHGALNDFRRETVERLLKEYDGNKSKVARRMGIARTTLYRIIKEMERQSSR